ncbi:hypothetical protein NS506_02575 [Nocardia seriolae]|uniref:Uncharacterized protein n=2 Tax=Nocardia seriolae TaxID=37332 RepID=A0ABC8AR43_9NOCA|nr:hypothetical protein NS506_02575 [Nocardia seriolae]
MESMSEGSATLRIVASIATSSRLAQSTASMAHRLAGAGAIRFLLE